MLANSTDSSGIQRPCIPARLKDFLGHIRRPVEYDGEWGCTQFVEETEVAHRGGRAIVAKPVLLSGALVGFGYSNRRDGAKFSERGGMDRCAAVRDTCCSEERQEPVRGPTLFVRRRPRSSTPLTH